MRIMNDKPVLCIDIGGTAVKIGLVNTIGALLDHNETSVNYDDYQTPIIKTVKQSASEFLVSRGISVSDLAGIGISATGQIDSVQGIVVGSGGNIPGWTGTPIKSSLIEQFNLPVTIANDANCMCLGESWVGAAQNCTDVIGITIGTGIGGGIITGGHLLEGSCGLGGELGHIQTHAGNGLACGCGNSGCWEMYASTTALVRRAVELNASLNDGRAVFANALSMNTSILALLNEWIDEIAYGLVGLVHIFNPKIILIGGGVCSQQELFIEPLSKRVHELVMPAFSEKLTIKAASLKNNAGLIGAAQYFYKHYK